MNKPIYPLILCGGMGARLWPMSRIDQPKQFQPVRGKGSLSYFQTTVQRHRGDDFYAPIVVTSAAQTVLVHRQLQDLQIKSTVIAEPMGRNTGPAVLAAALTVAQTDPEALLLVLPSDHIITGNLNATILSMRDAADDGRIVLFGIPPTYPETGYGYIMDGGGYGFIPGLHRVDRFIEKPPIEVAKSLIAGGNAYWASGISMFRADVIIEEFLRFDPHTFYTVSEAVTGAVRTENTLLLDAQAFSKATSEPTERLVFERSPTTALAPTLNIEWDDVGAWNAVQKISAQSEDGNVKNGDILVLDTKNSLIQSENRLVAVIGLRDMIVIDTPDALLVTNRENAQNVKQVVDQLKSQSRREVQSHVIRETSWGRVEPLSKAQGYDMRMIVVAPGATVRVNGTGIGPSLLTFINGGAVYEVDGHSVTAKRGESVTIAADVILPMTNVTGRELRAMQLMLTTGGEDPEEMVGIGSIPIAPMFAAPKHPTVADKKRGDAAAAIRLARAVV
jgi:mannose-1-phosphate guanylyltransferase / mannose-6-phosphate isomerase